MATAQLSYLQLCLLTCLPLALSCSFLPATAESIDQTRPLRFADRFRFNQIGQVLPQTPLQAQPTAPSADSSLDVPLRPSIKYGHNEPPANVSDSPLFNSPPPEKSISTPHAATERPITTVRVTQALNEGLMKSPRTSAARANLGIAKAQYAAATEMSNPSFFRDQGAVAEQVTRVGGQFVWDPPWKIAFRLLAAKRQVKEAKLAILSTLWAFRNDVRRSYTETVVAHETYKTLRDLSELTNRLLEVTHKRFQAGDVPELDVLKAKLAADQTKIDLEQGFRRIGRAEQGLNVILGRTYDQPIHVSSLPPFQLKAEKSELLPDFDAPVPPLKDLLERAMENRLELRLNAQQIKVAQAQLYVATGNIIPNPAFMIGSSKAGNPPSGPKLSGFWFTVTADMPAFSYSQGDITRLKATIKQLHSQDGAIRNQIISEVSAAYNNLLIARARIQAYQDHLLAASEEIARLARRSYEVGQSDITATLAAQQSNIQVRGQYLEAVQAYQTAFTDLEQSIGEPLQ